MSDLERVTVNLIPKAFRALTETAELTELSKTDVINRAVQFYAFAERVIAEGGEIVVQRDGGSEVIKFI